MSKIPLLLAAFATFLLLTSIVSARDCTEILFSNPDSNWNQTMESYRDCLLQEWLDSSPYRQYYSNSSLSDNASIIKTHKAEIQNLLNELLSRNMTITIVTINQSDVPEDLVSYLMLASNTSVLLLANGTNLLAFSKDNEYSILASYLMQHAYGKDSEHRIYHALYSLQQKKLLEASSPFIFLLVLILSAIPLAMLLILTPKTSMPAKLCSCLASFIFAMTVAPSDLLPLQAPAPAMVPSPAIKTVEAQSSGKSWYVDNAASGSGGDGSKENPWGPSEIPWSTFLAGSDDTYLYFFGGTYTNTLTIAHASSTNRLYIKPCSASPSPSGCSGEVIFNVTGGSTAIILNGRYVTIDGETTTGSGTRNMKLELGTSGRGIDWGGMGANYINNAIRYITFQNMTDTIWAQSKYIIAAPGVDGTEIAYNHFSNNQGLCEIFAFADTSGYGKILIHHNTASKITVNFLSGGGGVDFYNNNIDATDSQEPYDIIHYYSAFGLGYLRVWDNYFKSIDQMLFLENKSNTIPYHTQHVRIYNNTFTTPTSNFGIPILIHFGKTGNLDDVIITNNTFVNTKHGIISVCYPNQTCTIGPTSPVKIVNNIFKQCYVNEFEGTWTWVNEGDSVFDYNLMYSTGGLSWQWYNAPGGTRKTYTSLTTWNTDHPTQNHNPASANPLFVSASDFHLQASSPAIDVGTSLSTHFTTDLDGTTRPVGAAWDIGAYEYAGAPSQTCSQLGGSCCSSGQTCSGSFLSSSDCGSLCCVGGTCQTPTQTCSDGTPYGSCSSTKPLYCSSGTLINNCQACGCPSGQFCQAGGACESSSQYFLPEQYIEAESGTPISPMQAGSNSSASGGQYIYTPTSYQGSASYTFQISSLGKYRMEAKVLNYGTPLDAHDSFYVGLDSEPAQGNDNYTYDTLSTAVFAWDNVSLRGPTGNFSWAEFDPMVWDLTQDLHTFTFYGRESNVWLDRIILRKACHKSDSDCSGCVSQPELMGFISRWYVNNQDVSLKELIEAIGL